MSRFSTLTGTTSSIAAAATLQLNLDLPVSTVDIAKLKVTQDSPGGSIDLNVCKSNTFGSTTRLVRFNNQVAPLLYPVDITSGSEQEGLEGFLLPYEDSNAANKFHLEITNNDGEAHTYTYTILYEQASSVKIHTATVVLTDDQVKQLPSSRVLLVPAPGAGKYIHVYGGILLIHKLALFSGMYTNIDSGAYLSFFELADDSFYGPYADAGYLGSDQPDIIAPIYQNGAILVATGENQPVSLGVLSQSSGDFTGGDPGNTVTAIIHYAILDLV